MKAALLILSIFLSSQTWAQITGIGFYQRAISIQFLAGNIISSGGGGASDGIGSAARFNSPKDVAVDSAGNVYVVDFQNHTIRKITPAGVVTTFAGLSGSSGSADGTGSAARFNGPYGIVIDSSDNIYVADRSNYTIRKITPARVVTTFAGLAGSSGSTDGTGSAARFLGTTGMAIDSSGNLYVTERNAHTIRKITPAGVVTTLAGLAGSSGSANGTGSAARFYNPSGVAVDSSGDLYVTDESNHTIRKVTSAGVVTTLAGSAGSSGSTNGTGSGARFYYPADLIVDSSGDIYVSDTNNNKIRKVTTAGVVTNFAGSTQGIADGTGAAAQFRNPSGICISSSGDMFLADTSSHTVRKVTSAAVVTTLAGMGYESGSADGTGSAAKFNSPSGATVDSSGNIYIADSSNHTIRKVTSVGVVTTLAGSAGLPGNTDATGSAARFNYPKNIVVNGSGDVYVADSFNQTIRKITSGGVVTTLAGTAGSSGSDDGTGSVARFYTPSGIAIDSSGDLYVADTNNHTIRKVTSAGVVTTLAGTAGSSGGSDGAGAAARFNRPSYLAVDSTGNVYVADTDNHTIRKITSAGVVTTLAGAAGSLGSTDGVGSAARFYFPKGIAVDSSGNVYVVDSSNHTIRRITPGGVVTTIAGVAGISMPMLGLLPSTLSGLSGLAIGDGKLFVTVNNGIVYFQQP